MSFFSPTRKCISSRYYRRLSNNFRFVCLCFFFWLIAQKPNRLLFHLKRFINPIYKYFECFYRLIFICFPLRCRHFIAHSWRTMNEQSEKEKESKFFFAIGIIRFSLWFFSFYNWIGNRIDSKVESKIYIAAQSNENPMKMKWNKNRNPVIHSKEKLRHLISL